MKTVSADMRKLITTFVGKQREKNDVNFKYAYKCKKFHERLRSRMITVGYPFTLASCDHVSATFQPDFFRPHQFITSSDWPVIFYTPSDWSSPRSFYISRRLNHRTITVCHFISDHNAVRRLPVFWTTTVPRHVLIVALGVHVSVVLTRTPLLNEARR